jgi:acyl-CoA synthetase (AMP-forming)/AMP-acid ligase II
MSDALERMAQAEARLLGSGGPFETEEALVLGERVRVFKARAPHLRALLEGSARLGDAEYMVFRGRGVARRFSYAEHLALVASTARVLRERYGVQKGDRVAILGENSPEWIIGFWATVSLGAVAVGLNGWWTGDEIRYGLEDSGPKVLLADEKRLARLEGSGALAPPRPTQSRDPGVPILTMDASFEAVWKAYPDEALPDVPIAPDDPAVMLYTSGTTGRARAVVHTHLNVCSAVCLSFFHGARVQMLHPPTPLPDGSAPPNHILVTSPLFHVSGLHAAAITGLAGGAKTVWTVGRFDPEVALQVIEEERITGWGYTQTVLHRLLAHPGIDRYDLSSLRVVGGGGSPISEALQRRARARMPTVHHTLGVGYGLTEATAFTTICPGEELLRYPESAGRVLPTVEVEIRGPSGAALPDGEEGEIFVRGPLVMKEYFGQPEATAEVLYPGRWLKTGDIGRLEGGRLYLASRKRDLILRGGENVYPAEIEQRLEAHPDILEAAVISAPSVELGQEVKAVIVPVHGKEPSSEALARWVGEALAYYKVPTHWVLRSEPLPRNATGKVLKRVLLGQAESTFIDE